MLATAALLGLACAAPPAGVAAQPANNPIVQVVCQPLGGGITMFYDNPVIVIPPFKVVGRMCERRQAVGTPSS